MAWMEGTEALDQLKAQHLKLLFESTGEVPSLATLERWLVSVGIAGGTGQSVGQNLLSRPSVGGRCCGRRVHGDPDHLISDLSLFIDDDRGQCPEGGEQPMIGEYRSWGARGSYFRRQRGCGLVRLSLRIPGRLAVVGEPLVDAGDGRGHPGPLVMLLEPRGL